MRIDSWKSVRTKKPAVNDDCLPGSEFTLSQNQFSGSYKKLNVALQHSSLHIIIDLQASPGYINYHITSLTVNFHDDPLSF